MIDYTQTDRGTRLSNEFADTYGRPFDSNFARSLSERDDRIIDEGEVMGGRKEGSTTFKQWITKARSSEPKLDENKIKYFKEKHNDKSFFDMGEIDDLEDAHVDLLGTKMPLRRLRGDPAKRRFPQKAERSKFIPGYSGHTQGAICGEDVGRVVGAGAEEGKLRQDLSVNMSSTIKCGYDFTYAAPTRWGMSTSQAAMSETIAKSRRPKFTLTEKVFMRNESDFIKHGCLRMKNERIAKESVLRKKKEQN